VIVPIFPLPNVVFFPKTLLPLHIFEKRYRVMTRDALESERKIVMCLLRQGWESRKQENPAVHEIACLGEIENYEELEDGKYNLVLAGTHRVKLVTEIRHSPYRLAKVEILPEAHCDERALAVVRRRNYLTGLFARFTELSTGGKYRAQELLPQLSFEGIVNMIASVLNLDSEDKQALLEIDDLTERCDTISPVLRRQVESLVVVRNYEHLKPTDPSRN